MIETFGQNLYLSEPIINLFSFFSSGAFIFLYSWVSVVSGWKDVKLGWKDVKIGFKLNIKYISMAPKPQVALGSTKFIFQKKRIKSYNSQYASFERKC